MKDYTPHVRRAVIASAIAVLTVFVLWGALWSLAAMHYRGVIQGWIDSGRASGYKISYDDSRLFGFPARIVMRFTNVEWRNTADIVFHADDIDIGASPWQTQVFNARFKNHVQITAPLEDTTGTAEAHALVLGGVDGRAHIELDNEGYWKLSRISLTNAELGRVPGYIVKANRLEVAGQRPPVPPSGHSEAGLTLNAAAKDITLPDAMPSPFGLTMAALDVDLRVMGAVPDFRKRESTDQWNKDSGIVEFDKLAMEWGPLRMTARGTVGFDDDLQPEGAFVGSVTNHEAVLKALLEHDFIPRQQENMLESALSLFAKPSKFDKDPAIEIPIAVQLGGLFLGPVRLFMFPPIDWPTAAPSPAEAPENPTLAPPAAP